MTGPPLDTRAALAALTSLGEMRVWSVLVTVFGDALAPRGGVVPATALQAIFERYGTKPEAVRVALHRLVKDGWIRRERAGRQSYYGLTPRGEAEFLTASKRIYATGPALCDPWVIAVGPTEPTSPGWIALASDLYLAQGGAELPDDALVLSGTIDAFPPWAADRLAPAPLPDDYLQLFELLSGIDTVTVNNSIDAAALRILIVHQWRRLLLRHADLPGAFFPDGWRGEDCRALVLALRTRLSALADPWFDEVIGAPEKAS